MTAGRIVKHDQRSASRNADDSLNPFLPLSQSLPSPVDPGGLLCLVKFRLSIACGGRWLSSTLKKRIDDALKRRRRKKRWRFSPLGETGEERRTEKERGFPLRGFGLRPSAFHVLLLILRRLDVYDGRMDYYDNSLATSRRRSSELKRRHGENITRSDSIVSAIGKYLRSDKHFLPCRRLTIRLAMRSISFLVPTKEEKVSLHHYNRREKNPALIDHSIAIVIIIETRAQRASRDKPT